MKSILKATLYLFIGVLIGLNLSQVKTDKVISAEDKTDYYNSQVEFYDEMIEDVNTLKIYDTDDLTAEIMANRNGKIIIEKIVYKVYFLFKICSYLHVPCLLVHFLSFLNIALFWCGLLLVCNFLLFLKIIIFWC